MVDGLDFAPVKAVVCEADDLLRRRIQLLLQQLGFANLVVRDTPADCLPLIERGPVDLLICDDMDGGLGMVHGLRHHAIDNNPFVVSIATLDQRAAQPGAVARAVNSGPDALVLKPFAPAVFTNHILAIARQRKPFVATADYIGPTRRQEPRNQREAEMEFAVPNPVQEIASGISRAAVAARIQQGTLRLDRRKIGVDLAEIELRAGDVRGAVLNDVDGDAIRQALAKLRAATADIQRRAAKTRAAAVLELCRWMLAVAERIADETSRRDPRNLAALPQIIQGFKIALPQQGAPARQDDARRRTGGARPPA